MEFAIGDVLDGRNDPLGHFVVVVGVVPASYKAQEQILYYKVSSRTYKVFKKTIAFFNHCIENNYQPFFHHFSKEKRKQRISQAGQLSDAFFLDQAAYTGFLDEDSYLVFNNDPESIDGSVLNERVKEGVIAYRGRLSGPDIHKLSIILRHSPNVSKNSVEFVARSYNTFKKTGVR